MREATMTRTTSQKCAIFRALHEQGCFVLPNPWDVGSARFLQGLGFKALATTSAGYAWSQGQPDGVTSLEAVLAHLKDIASATDLPVNADFGNGFASDAEGVAKNVKLAIATGVAGLSIEDSTGDIAKPLFDIETAVARIRAARGAIDSAGGEVLLVGRAENYFIGRPDLADTIARLKAYSEAGADCLYAPGIETREDIIALVAAVAPKPFNLLIGANSALTLQDITDLGVRRISVGAVLAREAWGGFMRAARTISAGHFDGFDGAASGAQLNAFFRISGDAPLMKQPAQIIGKVEYREGEGPLLTMPTGVVEVETNSADAVLSWPDGASHGIAAMPVANFCQYVADGMITVAVKPPLRT
jgi:2-methylisocitrate lyase-like PEP mutase family enzyme